MSNLTILNTSVRQTENLFSLNDLHAISGNESKHAPFRFTRLDTTQELVEEIQKEDPSKPVVVRKNGIGTYACMEIALAYAMWIDPKFHLVVLRAYMAMKNDELQNSQPTLPLAEPEKTFNLETTESTARDLIWALFATAQMHTLLGNLEPALQAIGSNFHPMVYSHHREYAPQIKTAVDFMKQLIQPFKESNDLDWQRLVHNLERIEAEQQNAQQKRAKHLPYRHF